MNTVRTARLAGADTVLFSDTKINLWFSDANSANRTVWLAAAKALRDGIHGEGMKMVWQTVPVGYCTPLLNHDPNLATGAPIRNAPYVVTDGVLVPQQTATLTNGSFENFAGNSPTGWDASDGLGSATFTDSTVAHQGQTSMRFENATAVGQGAQARAFQTFTVQPFQQYVLHFWVRAEGLSADYIGPYVADADTQRSLTQQYQSTPAGDGSRNYVTAPRNWTTGGWIEQSIAFDSLDATRVTIAAGVWGWTSGKLWIDDFSIASSPTLNLIRRTGLPTSVRRDSPGSSALVEGVDFTGLVDTQLGQSSYPGNFDTYHAAPVLTVPATSSLVNGDRVLFSGYVAQVTTGGQVGCSWQDPALLNLMKRVHTEAAAENLGDGYLIDLEEVRTGGWEPIDELFATSGAGLAAHTARVVTDAQAATGKPIYLWSDMLDPNQNAVANFYHVKGTLAGSWVGVPRSAIILNWKEGVQVRDWAQASVKHFADLGFSQIAAAFYDNDVTQDHTWWTQALAGQPNIVGSMYTTWTEDFTQLPTFANLWWR
jgi:Carbohydrate binding domain